MFPSPPPSLLGGRGTGGGAGGGREGGEDVRGELKRASKKLHGFKFFNEENSQETDTNAFLEKKKVETHTDTSLDICIHIFAPISHHLSLLLK